MPMLRMACAMSCDTGVDAVDAGAVVAVAPLLASCDLSLLRRRNGGRVGVAGCCFGS